jgi:hypothetical protein
LSCRTPAAIVPPRGAGCGPTPMRSRRTRGSRVERKGESYQSQQSVSAPARSLIPKPAVSLSTSTVASARRGCCWRGAADAGAWRERERGERGALTSARKGGAAATS